MTDYVTDRLFELSDEKYKQFHSKLMPTVNPDTVIGVRVPLLRKLAKELIADGMAETFLSSLPHKYYDENTLHGIIISYIKDYDEVIALLDDFLPYVDNWATCDLTSPKVFKNHKDKLLNKIYEWIATGKAYTVRFGIEMLMTHFLDDDFSEKYPKIVSSVRHNDYYVKMMIAWYFATALAKQYDAILPYIEENRLEAWTHNKTIQKAVESYRISNEQKVYLRTLKRK